MPLSGQTPAEVFLGGDGIDYLAANGIGPVRQASYTAWTSYQYSHTHLAKVAAYYAIPPDGTMPARTASSARPPRITTSRPTATRTTGTPPQMASRLDGRQVWTSCWWGHHHNGTA